jgi:hypothetical protein
MSSNENKIPDGKCQAFCQTSAAPPRSMARKMGKMGEFSGQQPAT